MERFLSILKLCDAPEWAWSAANWFHTKWGIPVEEYDKSIAESIQNPRKIPQWYLVCDSRQQIVAGCGMIVNDFHRRTDLFPNVCALYVEPFARNQGVARNLLEFVRKDAFACGFHQIYLVTDHDQFYEKCGWSFWGMVPCEDGSPIRMYVVETIGE